MYNIYEEKELISQDKLGREELNYLNQSGTLSPSWPCAHLDIDDLPVHTDSKKLLDTADKKLITFIMNKDISKDWGYRKSIKRINGRPTDSREANKYADQKRSY